jgi:hypothetical protein
VRLVGVKKKKERHRAERRGVIEGSLQESSLRVPHTRITRRVGIVQPPSTPASAPAKFALAHAMCIATYSLSFPHLCEAALVSTCGARRGEREDEDGGELDGADEEELDGDDFEEEELDGDGSPSCMLP